MNYGRLAHKNTSSYRLFGAVDLVNGHNELQVELERGFRAASGDAVDEVLCGLKEALEAELLGLGLLEEDLPREAENCKATRGHRVLHALLVSLLELLEEEVQDGPGGGRVLVGHEVDEAGNQLLLLLELRRIVFDVVGFSRQQGADEVEQLLGDLDVVHSAFKVHHSL